MEKKKITICIRQPGFPIKEITIKKGINIKEVLGNILHLSMDSLFISVNGKSKSFDYILKNNDMLSIGMSTKNRVTVKCNGNNWRIHVSDKDNFPSDFHAHNIEKGDKLDLYNGYLYNSVTKKFRCAIHAKDLIMILSKLQSCNIKELSLKANVVLSFLKNN